MKNCGDFMVYRLGPTGFCPSAYCVKGKFRLVHFIKFIASEVLRVSSLDSIYIRCLFLGQ